jgi:hypothetical protein
MSDLPANEDSVEPQEQPETPITVKSYYSLNPFTLKSNLLIKIIGLFFILLTGPACMYIIFVDTEIYNGYMPNANYFFVIPAIIFVIGDVILIIGRLRDKQNILAIALLIMLIIFSTGFAVYMIENDFLAIVSLGMPFAIFVAIAITIVFNTTKSDKSKLSVSPESTNAPWLSTNDEGVFLILASIISLILIGFILVLAFNHFYN